MLDKLNPILWMILVMTMFLQATDVEAGDYEDAVVGHVITETVLGRDIDREKIMANELERIMHRQTIEILGVLAEHLPHVLKGIQTELKLKADQKYKCSLLEGTNYPCEE
mgnify:CR=1 FL=1|tara:strand:+ start:4202 stop:4531 length:330 start_codon:yes stop_codon:yes gene_type:complete